MLTEEQKRMHRVCFTGHRPEKLKQSESGRVFRAGIYSPKHESFLHKFEDYLVFQQDW